MTLPVALQMPWIPEGERWPKSSVPICGDPCSVAPRTAEGTPRACRSPKEFTSAPPMTSRWQRQFSHPGFPIPRSSPCRLFSPLSILSLFSPGLVRAGDQSRSSPAHQPVLPSAESVPPHFSPKITFHRFLWTPRYWELPRAASVLPLFPGAGRWLSRGSGGSATRRSREGSRHTAVI